MTYKQRLKYLHREHSYLLQLELMYNLEQFYRDYGPIRLSRAAPPRRAPDAKRARAMAHLQQALKEIEG